MKKLSLLLCLQLASASVVVAQPSVPGNDLPKVAAKESASEPAKMEERDLKTEANIAKSVARVLEGYHYSQIKFDDELSSKFLDRYFETLDGLHLHFLQSDIDEFSKYRNQLDDKILREGDTGPAHEIFARLMQRVEQRVAYVNELLKKEKFEFKGNDRYIINRKDLPRPKTLAEAKELWRQHLRSEYLQLKLDALDKEKNDKTAKLKDSNLEDNATFTYTNKEGKVVSDKIKADPKKKDEKPKKLTPAEQHAENVKTLTTRYTRLQKTLKDLGPDEVLELYLTALSHVYDPHSDYMGRAQMENFAISMKLSLFGIGAVLTTEDDYCKIQSLVDGPAKKSKQVKEGDRIVKVAQEGKEGVDVVGMKLNKVVEMIRGPKGTKVELTIIPVDAPSTSVRKTVTLVRDEIKLEDQEAKAKVIDMPGEDGKNLRLGVIDLPSFYEDMEARKADHKSTSADVAKLLKKLNEEKINGLILDLRRNGGGALSEAIRLTGLFIKEGPVVQTKDPSGRVDVKSDRDSSVLYNGPLIVLTSRFSASASEILAGALQDYGRALIVGDSSTHGKGTVQQLLRLNGILDDNRLEYKYEPGALKFTIQKFYRAGGSSTQLKGVVPDIILPSVNNYAEIGEDSLENPLEWDVTGSAKFEKLNRVEPYLVELKKRSSNRIGHDREFSYINEDIERFKKTLKDKSLSLNEDQRLKEMHEIEAVQEARKKERLAHKSNGQTVYEVTLKNADKPGLTLATLKTNETETASTSIHAGDESDDLDKTPAVDATLDEAKRILGDYISLGGKDFPTVVSK